MRVIFFGTSEYCIPILESIHKNFELKLVVTRPDKPVGRKAVLTPSATKLWAEKNNIPVATPATLKKDAEDRISLINHIGHINPDLAVVSDYGLIIPEKIFNLPKFGTINVHFSKLPDLRGPSPVQFALLRGDDEIWVSVFKLQNPPELEIKMDSGPILFQESYPILADDTTSSLYKRLFKEAATILPELISRISHIRPIPQDHSQATFCRFLTKEDGFIKWEEIENSALQTYRRYQAMTPWPGLWTLRQAQGKQLRMKILKCHLEDDQPKAGAPWVQKLILDEVQFEGKKPQKPSGLYPV